MRNKIFFFIPPFIVFIIFLIGCSKTANIGWEGVNVKLSEYSKVPAEYAKGTNYEDKPLEIMRLEISGSPRDHYYASQILEVMEFLDSTGTSCDYIDTLEGFDTDILLTGKGYTSFLINCEGEGYIIFRNSAEELLDSISAKWKITPSENPSNAAKTLLAEWKKAEKKTEALSKATEIPGQQGIYAPTEVNKEECGVIVTEIDEGAEIINDGLEVSDKIKKINDKQIINLDYIAPAVQGIGDEEIVKVETDRIIFNTKRKNLRAIMVSDMAACYNP